MLNAPPPSTRLVVTTTVSNRVSVLLIISLFDPHHLTLSLRIWIYSSALLTRISISKDVMAHPSTSRPLRLWCKDTCIIYITFLTGIRQSGSRNMFHGLYGLSNLTWPGLEYFTNAMRRVDFVLQVGPYCIARCLVRTTYFALTDGVSIARVCEGCLYLQA